MMKKEHSQASLSAKRKRGKQSWLYPPGVGWILMVFLVTVHASPPRSLYVDSPWVSKEHTRLLDLANIWTSDRKIRHCLRIYLTLLKNNYDSFWFGFLATQRILQQGGAGGVSWDLEKDATYWFPSCKYFLALCRPFFSLPCGTRLIIPICRWGFEASQGYETCSQPMNSSQSFKPACLDPVIWYRGSCFSWRLELRVSPKLWSPFGRSYFIRL